jgi:hypothetical protein
MVFSGDQITVAAQAWLDSVRRQMLARNPDRPLFIPSLMEMPMADRVMLLRAMKTALAATDPKNVQQVRDRDAQNSVP